MIQDENYILVHEDGSIPTISDAKETLIESKAQLVEYLETGCKPPWSFRLGVEQERFVFQTSDYSPAVYDGLNTGIRALLRNLQDFGWSPIRENGQLIALSRGEDSITIEPGGQIELSGTPVSDVHQILEESQFFNTQLKKVAEPLSLTFLSLGHQPKHSQNELPWMPKQRYGIMRSYMPKQGSLGLDMMQSTCSIQVNMDFSNEADMVKKYRVALALQPLVTALFANSPFSHGKPNAYLSYRQHIWRHTDDDRCGNLPFVFEEGMGFERYMDYVLDVPMYFVIRDGNYIDANGLSFRDFLAGQLTVLPGQLPLLSDWETHLSTVFPDVRLKRHLEMRGADAGGSSARVAALSALWASLLYDSESLDEAWECVKTWKPEEHLTLKTDVARQGFSTEFRNRTVQDLCLWILDLARQGLQRRNLRNHEGHDESCFLEALQEVAQSGRTFAEHYLQRFEHEWHHDIDISVRAICEETSL